ncbi:MAG: nicotinate (nicotinamide) nucleotide adenylyltransferase [Candidatus Riflebacteria bacterium]|nr:nicotinate (nicotinamide) nucleotide adenylyltransferase [Candidatus Riflebacteria bacterium]
MPPLPVVLAARDESPQRARPDPGPAASGLAGGGARGTGPPEVSPGPRLGILGGTFDPPHEGHLEMARLARDLVALDRVLWVPVLSPSHKSEATASFEDRLRMTELAVEGEPAMEASDVESRLGLPSYTVDLLAEVGRQAGSRARLFFIVGADSLEQFHLWVEFREILRMATLVVVSRPGHDFANPVLTPEDWARVILLPGLASPASSSRFRQSGDGLVPPRVLHYIAARDLYRR